MRGRFIEKVNYEVNFSFGGALSSKSEFNPTRAGMPDLDTMIELGPAYVYKLYRGENFQLKITLPLRIALSTDFKGIDDRGLVFNPIISYLLRDFFIDGTFLFSAISTRFATQKLHRYFYQVDPQYVTPNRELYSTAGGYLSTSVSLGVGKFFNQDKMIFIGTRHTLLAAAANYDSPLLVSKSNTSLALGFIWWIWQSKNQGHK
jgi:MipA family protein